MPRGESRCVARTEKARSRRSGPVPPARFRQEAPLPDSTPRGHCWRPRTRPAREASPAGPARTVSSSFLKGRSAPVGPKFHRGCRRAAAAPGAALPADTRDRGAGTRRQRARRTRQLRWLNAEPMPGATPLTVTASRPQRVAGRTERRGRVVVERRDRFPADLRPDGRLEEVEAGSPRRPPRWRPDPLSVHRSARGPPRSRTMRRTAAR